MTMEDFAALPCESGILKAEEQAIILRIKAGINAESKFRKLTPHLVAAGPAVTPATASLTTTATRASTSSTPTKRQASVALVDIAGVNKNKCSGSPPPVSFQNQTVYGGSMTAAADVSFFDTEIQLKWIRLVSCDEKVKFNVTIPIENCSVYFCADTDASLFVFIKMSRSSASQLMRTFSISIAMKPYFLFDPGDEDERFHYIAFKRINSPLLEQLLMKYPKHYAKVISRSRAATLFKMIKQSNDQLQTSEMLSKCIFEKTKNNK